MWRGYSRPTSTRPLAGRCCRRSNAALCTCAASSSSGFGPLFGQISHDSKRHSSGSGRSAAKMLRVLTDWYPQAVLDEATVKQAATNGHLDLLWWMHKRMEMECSGMEKLCKLLYSSETIALVAGRGHLEVVKWLVEARGGECSAAPLHQAARNGQVEVVEWLYDHSGCIVLPRAMDEAAACGFLDVASLFAVAHDHVEVLHWLREHYACTMGNKEDLYGTAQYYGRVHILAYLLDQWVLGD
ncbi:Ankyrin repeat-containing domain [Phytophthora cactorum]|nr:Ankyrin repeat-containing domain [Phytophthora cactorum]